VVTLRRFSDFDFFRDFERSIDRASLRFVESRGFLAGSWGPHLVNFQVTDRETFVGGSTTTDRRLPELEYVLRATQLGPTPLVLKVDSSLAYLSVDRSATYRSDYGRVDLQPELSLPFRPAPWLSFALSAGERFTWYGDSLDATGQAFTGESLARTVPVAGAEVIGPSFSRVFGRGAGGARFKHVVEPRLTYAFQGAFDDAAAIPPFDQVDSLGSGNLARFSLINRLKAKPAGEGGGSAQEILSFEVARSYSFDDARPLEASSSGETSQAGPLDAILRFNPGRDVDLRATATYSMLFRQLLQTSLASGVAFDRARVDLRWNVRYRGETGETLSNQVRLATALKVLPGRLGLQASLDYDVELALLRDQRYTIDFTAKCYGVRLEVRQFDAADRRTTDYRIAFTLRNVGTFLDLTGSYE
jgi:LPS-assembly protein